VPEEPNRRDVATREPDAFVEFARDVARREAKAAWLRATSDWRELDLDPHARRALENRLADLA
jgi:hypothetical protein